MPFPKWKYRKHPELGVFQSTRVLTAEAEKDLGDTWHDDATKTGFAVVPENVPHRAHVDSPVLMRPVAVAGPVTNAGIAVVHAGDKFHG